jgi:hypothetical protein
VAEQVQRHAGRVLLSDGFGEAGQIGHISAPIIDPHHAWVLDVAGRFAVPTMLEHTYRIAGKQEVPDQLVIFFRELGEPVADDDGPAEGGGGALLANCVELGRVVAQVVQLTRASACIHNAGKRLNTSRSLGSGRVVPAFISALLEGGQHHVRHRFGVLVFVDHRHLHVHYLTASKPAGADSYRPPPVAGGKTSDQSMICLTERPLVR